MANRIIDRSAEERLNRIEKLVNTWHERLASIDYNLKHYVKKRMPRMKKREQLSERAIHHMETLLKAFEANGHSGVMSTNRGKDKRIIFMCNHNQAVKLRAFLDNDLRNGHLWKTLEDTALEVSNGD